MEPLPYIRPKPPQCGELWARPKKPPVGKMEEEKDKTFHQGKGITYFSKKTERTLFFALTLAMLAWGILEMLGWL